MSDSAPSSGQSAVRDSKPAGIDWTGTMAGALAAVTSAFLLSTLGAVGTLVGAALGSVAATIGTNLYSRGLAKSREKVAQAQALTRLRSAGMAGARQGSASADVAGAQAPAESAGEPADETADKPADEAAAAAEVGEVETLSWRERLRVLPWKRIGWGSLALFLVAVAAITVFELLAGQSVSSMVNGEDDGRTTISGVTGGAEKSRKEKGGGDPSPGATATPEESSSPSPEPAEEPEESESADPEEEPSATTSTEPSPDQLEQPSNAPSVGGEASPSPGAGE